MLTDGDTALCQILPLRILANSAVNCMDADPCLSAGVAGKAARCPAFRSMEQGQYVFTAMYAVESLLKVWTLGLRHFRRSGADLFDALIVLVSVTMAILVGTVEDSRDLEKAVLIITPIRMFRVVLLPWYREVMTSLRKTLPVLKMFGTMLFMVYYFYSIVIGVFGVSELSKFDALIPDQNFTDTFFMDGPQLEYAAGEYVGNCKEDGSDFERLEEVKACSLAVSYYYGKGSVAGPSGGFYYLNSFNGIHRAFMTLFELMVVNNWMVIVDGFVVATGSSFTRYFFLSFNIVCVIIALNVFQAFVIEAFQGFEDFHPKALNMLMDSTDDDVDLEQRSTGRSIVFAKILGKEEEVFAES